MALNRIDVPYANAWRNILSAGQPSKEQLKAARDAGFTIVVDLRVEGEFSDFDEPAVVESLGMRYVRIPVNGRPGVTEGNARALQSVIRESAGAPVLVHCGTGNRVGALIALGEWLDGADPESAIAAGRQAGLVGLEPALREIMST